MGKVVPRKCATRELGSKKCFRMEFSLEHNFIWVLEEEVQRKCAAMYIVAVNIDTVEMIKEEEEEKEGK